MSRYVNAEWLIKESMPLSFSVQKWVNEVQIMTAPSIDIVRCGECKWRKACKVFSPQQITNDSFCSWGERKDDE